MSKILFPLKTVSLLIISLLLSCNQKSPEINQEEIQVAVSQTLDDWHDAAARADFKAYFGLMDQESVFIGTEATEIWDKTAFENYSKPHFDRGKAWSFSTIQRNIYVDPTGEFVWFDELLKTSMGICRGSGVVVFKPQLNQWKIKHYVLSIDIPNEKISETIALKKEWDSLFLVSAKKQ